MAQNDNFRLKLARKLVQAGRLEEAAREYRNYLGDFPEDVDAFRDMGDLRARQEKFELAAKNYKQAIRIEPGNLRDQHLLAQNLTKAGKREQSVIEWRRVARLAAGTPLATEAENKIEELLQAIKLGSEDEDLETENEAEKEISDLNQNLEYAKNFKESEKKTLKTKSNSEKKIPSQSQPQQKEQRQPEELAEEDKNKSKTSTEVKKDSVDENAQKQPTPKKVDTIKSESTNQVDSSIYNQPEFMEAKALYHAKKYGQALNQIHSSIRKVPGHPGSYYLAGVIRYNKGELSKAEYNFKKSFDYPEKGFNAHYYLGRIHQKKGEFRTALNHFNTYVTLTNSEKGKQQAYNHIKQIKSRLDHSVQNEKTKVDQNPTVPKPPDSRPVKRVEAFGGEFRLWSTNSTPEGSESAKRAAEAAKNNQYDRALQIIKKHAMDYGGSPDARLAPLNLASVYVSMNLAENAEKHVQNFLTRGGGLTEKFESPASYILALAYIEQGEYDKALERLSRVKTSAKIGPTPEQINMAYADIYQRSKFPAKAINYYEKVAGLSSNPVKKSQVRLKMAELWLKMQNKQKAIQAYRDAKSNCGDSLMQAICRTSGIAIADLHFHSRNWKKALLEYQDLAKNYPKSEESAWVNYQIANILKRQNDFSEALTRYKYVIDNYPGSYWAQQAEWKREDTIWEKEYEEVLD